MTDHGQHQLDDHARTRRKFLAGAGLAAGAAGAATLLAATPAAATTPATGEFDLDLKWGEIDVVPWILHDVDLGDGGFAKGVFSAFGDMAALSIRILVGEEADTGDGPWMLDGSTMPTGYVPATPPNDVTPAGTPGWGGVGAAMDYSNVSQNTYELQSSWGNFTNVGQGTLMVWTLPNEHNTFEGNVLFNFEGDTPFGAALAPGACLFTTLVYLRAPEAP
jgi:hypothetical protein